MKNFKTMKKITMLLVALFMFAATTPSWSSPIFDNDRPIEFNELPAQAQSFIKEYFSKDKVSYALIDEGIIIKEYKVIFESGAKVEFTGDGTWKDVECRYDAVPKNIVPAKIADYIKRHYPSNKITEISREYHEWEVKLSGGLELTFNKSFKIVDIDD